MNPLAAQKPSSPSAGGSYFFGYDLLLNLFRVIKIRLSHLERERRPGLRCDVAVIVLDCVEVAFAELRPGRPLLRRQLGITTTCDYFPIPLTAACRIERC